MAGIEPIAASVADFVACLAEPARWAETACGLMEDGECGDGPALVRGLTRPAPARARRECVTAPPAARVPVPMLWDSDPPDRLCC